ncbi:MAG TPA: rhomboid family intramembrane serine protease [Chitinophagaceae bacterium]
MTQFRPSRFEILPPVVKNLLIINGLMFLAQQTIKTTAFGSLFDLFALHTWQSPLFRPWQFVTHMFMHGDFMHLLFNMFALWMFGSILENIWGQKRFLTFYFVCGLGAALAHMIALYFENEQLIHYYNLLSPMEQIQLESNFYDRLNTPTVGASGAVFGCLTAFGYLFPNTYINVWFVIPIKAKWFVALYIVMELISTVQNSAGDNVAHLAHLGGALFGFIMVWFWNKKNRRTFY